MSESDLQLTFSGPIGDLNVQDQKGKTPVDPHSSPDQNAESDESSSLDLAVPLSEENDPSQDLPKLSLEAEDLEHPYEALEESAEQDLNSAQNENLAEEDMSGLYKIGATSVVKKLTTLEGGLSSQPQEPTTSTDSHQDLSDQVSMMQDLQDLEDLSPIGLAEPENASVTAFEAPSPTTKDSVSTSSATIDAPLNLDPTIKESSGLQKINPQNEDAYDVLANPEPSVVEGDKTDGELLEELDDSDKTTGDYWSPQDKYTSNTPHSPLSQADELMTKTGAGSTISSVVHKVQNFLQKKHQLPGMQGEALVLPLLKKVFAIAIVGIVLSFAFQNLDTIKERLGSLNPQSINSQNQEDSPSTAESTTEENKTNSSSQNDSSLHDSDDSEIGDFETVEDFTDRSTDPYSDLPISLSSSDSTASLEGSSPTQAPLQIPMMPCNHKELESDQGSWEASDFTSRLHAKNLWSKYELVCYIRYYQMKNRLHTLKAILDQNTKPWLVLYTISALLELGSPISEKQIADKVKPISTEIIAKWSKKFRNKPKIDSGEFTLMRILLRTTSPHSRLEILKTFRQQNLHLSRRYIQAAQNDPDPKIRQLAKIWSREQPI